MCLSFLQGKNPTVRINVHNQISTSQNFWRQNFFYQYTINVCRSFCVNKSMYMINRPCFLSKLSDVQFFMMIYRKLNLLRTKSSDAI